MNSYPVQLVHLAGRRVLIAGGGGVAAQKVAALLDAGACVHVVAPDVSGVEAFLRRIHRVSRRAVRDEDVDGAALVIAATNDVDVNRRLAAAARARGVLVNAVDDPPGCDFYLPAIVRRGPVTITVGTNGGSPLFAARLRRVLEAALPTSVGELGDFLKAARRRGLRGLARRGQLLKALADPHVARLVDRGEQEAALERLEEVVSREEERFDPGTVAIVGAGPAGRALLTLRALDRLQRADVVLHDALVTQEVLDEIPPNVRRVNVGRRAGAREPFPHALTERMMITEARAGRRVVRLHAGDAFVFGRGGEELDALDAAGVPYEAVPGVSSAIAAPVAAGVPLTHRELARGFTVRTGHVTSGPSPQLDRSEETQVVLMGLRNVDDVLAQLARDGIPTDTPAVMVSRAFRPDQRVVTGTVADLAAQIRSAAIEGPATLVVGRVAKRVAAQAREEVAA